MAPLWQEEGEQRNWLPDEFRKLPEVIRQIWKRKILFESVAGTGSDELNLCIMVCWRSGGCGGISGCSCDQMTYPGHPQWLCLGRWSWTD